jgi:formate-dependent nitrite reductase membrane component NrfD
MQAAESISIAGTGRPAEMIPPYGGETYYDIPPIKHSHYKWRTCAAFFLNSVAGGSQIISTLVDHFGGEKDRTLVRAGRYIALAGGLSSTAVLISALHTPQRWYNMLRLFKSTSPMSIGIWSITPFVELSGLTAIGQIAEDLGKKKAGGVMGCAFGIPAALLGAIVTTYMGTELEETNMPLWASAYPLMAPLYGAAALSASAAALSITAAVTDTPDAMKNSLNRIALASGAAEMALSGTIESRWRRLRQAASFARASYAPLYRIGYMGAGLLMPLILRGFDGAGRNGRNRNILASFATLAGNMILQYVMVYGGKESGLHARDYFEYTRPKALEGRTVSSPLPRRKKQIPAKRTRPLSAMIGLSLLALGTAAIVFSSVREGETR